MNSPYEAAVRRYRTIDALTPARWQFSSFTTGDQAEIHYHRTGGDHKTALIALHGFQSAGLTWLRTTRALETDYDLILPDFRGHGHSNSSVDGFSLERLTDDIAELVNVLRLEKPLVIGHSMGAEVAGRLAVAYPDGMRALILVEPPMRAFAFQPDALSGEGAAWYQQWLATMQAIRTQPHVERMSTGLRLLPLGVGTPNEEDFVPSIEATAQLNLDLLRRASTMDYRIATTEIAARIHAPLFLMTGSPQRGSVATPEGIRTIVESGSRREAVSFENAGHFILFEQFNRFIAVVKDFLTRH
ncbi:MAG TPA: alpha/beta hydrolase [Aggregatilineales bacterium]|nr:alpha/beta hydrolase [Aggregatilineales bacterium]